MLGNQEKMVYLSLLTFPLEYIIKYFFGVMSLLQRNLWQLHFPSKAS